MKQSLLNEALNVLHKRKAEADSLASFNKQKALKDPSFSTLYKEYTSTMIENAKNEAYGLKSDKEKERKLKAALAKRLKELNITSLSPKYNCKHCEDTGFVDDKLCDCLKKEVTKILLEKSGFENLSSFESSDFEIFENQEDVKKIYNLLNLWCNKKDSNKNLVYLLGQTGTGKTHLLKCMANEFIKQNKIVLLTTAFNLSDVFLKYHTSLDKGDILDDILSCEVLFIDDLGTEPFFKNITREYFYLVINERRMKNLKTVITSNLSPNELRDRYDERIFSRVMDQKTSIVLKLEGCDKRLKNKK